MSILVIGGMGYIGSHVVVALQQAGLEPVILDDLSNSSASIIEGITAITGKRPTFYKNDFGDSMQLAGVLQKEEIDGVIHFAAFKAVAESVKEPLKYYHNNVSNFVNLLEMLGQYDVRNFVFSSSAAVYGTPESDQVSEEKMCKPESPYGWSKYMDEIVLQTTCKAYDTLKGVALRYFNVVGAHESAKIGELPKGKPQNLLPIIIDAAAGKGSKLTVYGNDYSTPDGTCRRDYVHVVDLAAAHVAALQRLLTQRQGSYDVFNVGTGKPTSVLELIEAFERVNGVRVPYEIGERRPGDPAAYSANVDKANRDLSWRAEKSIDDAVRSAWRWYRSIAGA